MKKFLLPFVALVIVSATANAQTTPKQSPSKTAAPKTSTTTKPVSGTETASLQKAKTTTPATTTTGHKKKHHHKAPEKKPATK